MKIRSEPYPDRIRRIAKDLSWMRYKYDVEKSVEKLLMVANVLEQELKKSPPKKN